MGRGQVLARILYQLPPSISEHNFYLCLGKVNFFLISTPVPSRKRHILNTGSISFTCSSLPHGLKKRYPFLCYHLSITYKGRIQTSLWAKARGMQKPCLIPLQINCRKHFFFFSFLCKSTRKINAAANTLFHGTTVTSSRCLCYKIILWQTHSALGSTERCHSFLHKIINTDATDMLLIMLNKYSRKIDNIFIELSI